MALIAIKVIFAVAVLVAGLVSVFGPLRLANDRDLVSLGNMMASGVLLSAGLVHQLADSGEGFESHGFEFPWAPFIMGTTFIGFLILETHINLYLQGKPSLGHLIHSHGHGSGEEGRYASDNNNNDTDHEHSGDDCDISVTRSSDVEDGLEDASENEDRPLVEEQESVNQARKSRNTTRSLSHSSSQQQHPNHGAMVASLLLMLAISVHSVLAGVAIGIETNVQSITSTAVAILAHKCFEGFALGSSLVGANMPTKIYVGLGVIFGFATPSGAFLGMAIDSELDEDSVAVAIVQAMVAGTFLYISIVEIGLKELAMSSSHHDHGVTLGPRQRQLEYRKLSSFTVGFMIMSFLAKFV